MEQDFSLEQKSLLFWLTLLKEPKMVQVTMLNGSKLNCFLHEINGDQTLLNVSELNTPMGKLDQAQIDFKDIRHITIL